MAPATQNVVYILQHPSSILLLVFIICINIYIYIYCFLSCLFRLASTQQRHPPGRAPFIYVADTAHTQLLLVVYQTWCFNHFSVVGIE